MFTKGELDLLKPMLLKQILVARIHTKERPNLKILQSILYKLEDNNE